MAQQAQLHAIVHGRVQGVSFRYYTQMQAERLRLTGWVCNQPDGAVEAEAFGREPVLLQFVEALRVGPGHARVEQAAEEWFESAEAPAGFRLEG